MFATGQPVYRPSVAVAERNGLVSSPRAVATFLTSMKPYLNEVTRSRAQWIRDIGVLLEDARRQHASVVAQGATRVGRAQVVIFREAHTRIAAIGAPADCEVIHRAVLTWLDKQMAACDVMVDVGLRGDLPRLREVQGLLAEGRFHAQKFNDEFVRLVALVRAAARAPSARGRTSRATSPRRRGGR